MKKILAHFSQYCLMCLKVNLSDSFSCIFQFTNEMATKICLQKGIPLCGVQSIQEAFLD